MLPKIPESESVAYKIMIDKTVDAVIFVGGIFHEKFY